jgi:hypothetical protein
MLALAKRHLQFAAIAPRHFSVPGEPWQLWVKGNKVTNDITTHVYTLVHDEEGAAYWETKKEVKTGATLLIDWMAIGAAMQGTIRAKWVFISKHVSGMCGIGKFMKRWKKWQEDKCPRCGAPEYSAHIWACKGEGTSDIWNRAIEALEQWLRISDTEPTVAHLIVTHLQRWRSGESTANEAPGIFQEVVNNQAYIGWHKLIEGWQSKEWCDIQQRYYQLIRSHKTGKRWVSALIHNEKQRSITNMGNLPPGW